MSRAAPLKSTILTLKRNSTNMTTKRRLSPDAKAAVMDALRAVLTEDRTDDLIARVVAKLPWWGRWLPVGQVLDRLLPETLLEFLNENL